MVPLPEALIEPFRGQLEKVKALHDADLAAGLGEVYLLGALARQRPNAPRAWIWQYVYTHVLNRGGQGVRSLLDALL